MVRDLLFGAKWFIHVHHKYLKHEKDQPLLRDRMEGSESFETPDAEPFDNEEVETKPLIFRGECLLCAKTEDEEDPSAFSGGLIIEGPSECVATFALLCTALRVKLNKRNSWDFGKEALPFCSPCLEIVRELGEIQERIRELEKRFAENVEAIRQNVIKAKAKGQDAEGRVFNFRNQIDRGRGRPQKHKSERKTEVQPKKPLSVKSKDLSQLGGNEGGQDSSEIPKRRSGRSSTRLAKSAVKTYVENDEDLNDENFPGAIDIKDFEYHPYEEENAVTDQMDVSESEDVKPLIEIKSDPAVFDQNVEDCEPLFPSEFLPFESDTTSNERKEISKTVRKVGPSRKRKGTVRSKKINQPKKRKYDSESSSESNDDDQADDYKDPEFQPGKEKDKSSSEGEMSEEDDELVGRVKKWIKSKTGVLSYNGIEVMTTQDGFKCSICEETVEGGNPEYRKPRMKRHIILKHCPKFTCELCDRVFESKSRLDLHIKSVHEKSIIHLCEVCGKPYTTKNAKERHKWSHQSAEEQQIAIAAGRKRKGIVKNIKKHQCSQCGKVFISPYFLKEHEETHKDMSERKKFICETCGDVYLSAGSLIDHVKKKHENIHPSKMNWKPCPMCQKWYPNASRLKIHMRYHTGEKPYKCPECGEGVRTSTLLKEHLNIHKDFRPHPCEDCEMSFFKKYHLRRHREVYHNSERPPPSRKQPYRSRNGTRKPYVRRNKRKTPNSEEQNSDPPQGTSNNNNVPTRGDPTAVPFNNIESVNNGGQRMAGSFPHLNQAPIMGVPFATNTPYLNPTGYFYPG